MTEAAIRELAPVVGTSAACRAVGRSRATHYRHHRVSPAPTRPVGTAHRHRAQPHALTLAERDEVLAVLSSDRFADAAPAQVWATLLDEGTYLASQSTMYRLLRQCGQSRERRRQARHPAHVKPELVATVPNQVWSWDITKLRGPAKWTSYYLYVVLDVFSRKAVGWLLAPRESAALAERLLGETISRERVDRDQLTIHADRGTSMASKPVALLLADLGVTKSHSRPRVSNDNPYSEAQFKTLKYCPAFPSRFGSLEHARQFCVEFFDAYNNSHRHSGLGLLTPAVVHAGQAAHVHAQRAGVLIAAHARHPDRFRRGQPQPPALPGPAWINKPEEEGTISSSQQPVPQTG